MNRHTFSILLFSLFALFATGCHADKSLVYLGNSNNLSGIDTPAGFDVSPTEANEIRNSTLGETIAVQHLYADDKNYYICDGFFKSDQQKAVTQGFVINGVTGLPPTSN